MASHFYGGGTEYLPVSPRCADHGPARASSGRRTWCSSATATPGFGTKDKIARDHLNEKGVRIHGIGIGGQLRLPPRRLCFSGVVDITDFELQDPSEATAHLATHVS
jgi:hypothetical protein